LLITPSHHAHRVLRKGKALSILAHKLGRVVYLMLERQEAFDLKKFVGAAA
jgi:hypothetical protein